MHPINPCSSTIAAEFYSGSNHPLGCSHPGRSTLSHPGRGWRRRHELCAPAKMCFPLSLKHLLTAVSALNNKTDAGGPMRRPIPCICVLDHGSRCASNLKTGSSAKDQLEESGASSAKSSTMLQVLLGQSSTLGVSPLGGHLGRLPWEGRFGSVHREIP